MKKLLNTLYVTNPKALVCKNEKNLMIKVEGKKVLQVPFHILESIVVFGHLGCTPAVIGQCAEDGISISFHDDFGRFLARVDGPVSGNVLLRRTQYRTADDWEASLALSQRFIAAKVHNTKIVLQRFKRDYPDEASDALESVIGKMTSSEKAVFTVSSQDELRGVEGDAAHQYFSVFSCMLRNKQFVQSFHGRVRRPPTDPVNALLSLFYSILSRDIVSSCEAVGLDPQVGFLHKDRPGRASLALDLMEEMRAYCVDRFVLSLCNRRQVEMSDFTRRDDGAVALKDDSRKVILGLWQERKQEQITHPFLKEKMMIGLLPYVQAQLLARFLRGDLEDYPAFLWR